MSESTYNTFIEILNQLIELVSQFENQKGG